MGASDMAGDVSIGQMMSVDDVSGGLGVVNGFARTTFGAKRFQARGE